MGKGEFITGTSTVEGFFAWINERHRIYCNRQKGLPKPWTQDPILQKFKFTNVFRQLDTGTVALQRMISGTALSANISAPEQKRNSILGLVVFNIIWYRLFNWHEHAIDPGWSTSPDEVNAAMTKKWENRDKVFTSAHMTTGRPMEDKVDTYAGAVHEAWDARVDIVKTCRESRSMEAAFEAVKGIDLVGPFVGYEIVCDFRFTELLLDATDICTWANVGPGASRGLRRLGLKPELQSMIDLWKMAPRFLAPHIAEHYGQGARVTSGIRIQSAHPNTTFYPPFELREIEHSLCEFDKYERARTGLGRPRQNYNGTG